MRFVIAAICLATISTAPARARTPQPAALTVVSTGTEQGLKYGETLLSRPFGAQFVDTIKLVGTYGSARERYYLVEGNAGANCPARYLIVAARPGQPPAISAPFGTCGVGATVRQSAGGLMISIAPGPTDRTPIRYSYGKTGLRQIDLAPQGGDLVAGAAGLRCPTPRAAVAVDHAAMTAEFDRILPAYYRTSGGVRKAEFAPGQLRDMVAGIACLAGYHDTDAALPEAASALFASKRYGDASFAALDQLATMRGADAQLRASARAFAATMHYYVARREAL